MHNNKRGRSWIYTPLNGLDQFGCAGKCDSGYHFDVKGMHAEKSSSSIVGLHSGDGLGDEFRFRIRDLYMSFVFLNEKYTLVIVAH